MIPPELSRLTNLTTLFLHGNQLTAIPPDLASLTNLTALSLAHNQLMAIPPELARLTNLMALSLDHIQLTAIPPDLARLTNLTALFLAHNQLMAIPPELARLTNLTILDLAHNQLTAIPPDLARLTNLTILDLAHNQLTAIPPDLARLTKLTTLDLSGNPLTTPPPEIVNQGTKAILSFLSQLAQSEQREWVSKLLLVGEGGVGKTCLLRRLRGEGFQESESTTHGIEICTLELPHPERPDVTMRLNAWDFGGQDIYHATHQFFLSNRSLFLLVWNARVGYEQSKIDYWLETIKARAPESPVMVVATRIDERAADLPLAELQRKFPKGSSPKRVGNFSLRGGGKPLFFQPGTRLCAERKRFRMCAVFNSTTSRARPAYRHPSVGRRSRRFASLLAGAPPRSRREKRVTRREHRGGLEACAGGQQQQQHLVLLVKNGPKLPTRFGEEPSESPRALEGQQQRRHGDRHAPGRDRHGLRALAVDGRALAVKLARRGEFDPRPRGSACPPS